MLIGSDIFFDLLKADKIRLANGNLILQESELGYVISGKLPTEVTPNYCCVAVETNLDNAIKEFFEIESFPTDSFDSTKSEEEKFCEEHFLKTHSRTKSGRYIVSLPMKENADPVLGFSRENVVKRLNGIWNKLNKNNTLATLYKAFLQEYLDLGHMQQIIDEDNTKSYNIPHHCIYKPEKTTTPLRVVFDASAETSTGQSLNSILLNGGSIQDDLFSLVTRFRTHKYAFSADIQKMYRQILVEPSQRYLQRIVWKETNNSPIKIYELNTVTYDTVSAPFLAMRVLKALADAEHQDFPEAAKIISRDMYMDDILSGAASLTSAKSLQADLIMYQTLVASMPGDFSCSEGQGGRNALIDGHNVCSSVVTQGVKAIPVYPAKTQRQWTRSDFFPQASRSSVSANCTLLYESFAYSSVWSWRRGTSLKVPTLDSLIFWVSRLLDLV
ncbi:hypothetical protein AVEN_112656-1 [Araneus ventricosus]|uniref:Peptidase aspartic putative domain-containing protein n=1 Tax=Araneus ventricosus TaxID=182803 RepID=A0A4Y2HWI0_ARAVE|nr:hypothetical protein AVEN_112656-1 [Araneus ventricosus]